MRNERCRADRDLWRRFTQAGCRTKRQWQKAGREGALPARACSASSWSSVTTVPGWRTSAFTATEASPEAFAPSVRSFPEDEDGGCVDASKRAHVSGIPPSGQARRAVHTASGLP